ncbi:MULTISPECIES: DUF6542 domain-containing protein [unclassified Corynebacterium]|uniref:DUF6542 domain-containing protein n=1 Tax=unclassified Corynebacterium TaxID=2624378 RepID=UPI0021678EAE|nr:MULTISPECIES: DUF6542 domain-containing protein [unclassified Corynebacterium]MCS4489924.1 hypothetical protein [Corynebacterium sp. ES2775-CONJ]MCS4491713.1 hypothetical protein [Corynebacterium sp. ES2715-CONJ3]MCS4531818.1 hypothetical protein [Corynebacterium sp. ES2730-CONJ]
MSTATSKSSSAPFYGFSLKIALLGLVAGSLTAVGATLVTGTLGVPFLAIFTFSALLVTILTIPKALFIIVSCVPVCFATSSAIAGWLIVTDNQPAQNLSTTEIISVFYPLMQHFPALLTATLLSGFIAVLRVSLLRRRTRVIERRVKKTLQETRAANARTTMQASQARSRVRRSSDRGTVTVEELLRRNARSRPPSVLERDPESRKPQTYALRPVRSVRPPEASPPQPAASEQAQATPNPRLDKRTLPRLGSLDDDLYS